MIALDTNILARLLLADDAKQFAQAKAVFAKDENFTAPITVMLELVWVLETYDLSATDICQALRKLIGLPNFKPAHESEILASLSLYDQGLDFADALHWQLSKTSSAFLTMDRKLAKKAAKMHGGSAQVPSSVAEFLKS